MKILFIAVFDDEGKSTNNAQAESFLNLGVDLIKYNYRIEEEKIGIVSRDRAIVDITEKECPDLVLFAKGNTIGLDVFKDCANKSLVGFWFPDPLITWNHMKTEMEPKAKVSSFFCCDKVKVLDVVSEINSESFLNCEGFTPKLNFPIHIERDLEVSFIGDVDTHVDGTRRSSLLNQLNFPVSIFSDEFGISHSQLVNRSKINLNFCTDDCASDRVYKILASCGLLFSEDWQGRNFIDGEDLVIFNSIDDLNSKIEYYLTHIEAADKIRSSGFKKVQQFTVDAWATRIIEKTEELL